MPGVVGCHTPNQEFSGTFSEYFVGEVDVRPFAGWCSTRCCYSLRTSVHLGSSWRHSTS
ncbi:hypothetical protein LINPERPRIM_LOCUS11102 [Linum perenne]